MRPLFLDTLTTYRERRLRNRQNAMTAILCGMCVANGLIAVFNFFN